QGPAVPPPARPLPPPARQPRAQPLPQPAPRPRVRPVPRRLPPPPPHRVRPLRRRARQPQARPRLPPAPLQPPARQAPQRSPPPPAAQPPGPLPAPPPALLPAASDQPAWDLPNDSRRPPPSASRTRTTLLPAGSLAGAARFRGQQPLNPFHDAGAGLEQDIVRQAPIIVFGERKGFTNAHPDRPEGPVRGADRRRHAGCPGAHRQQGGAGFSRQQAAVPAAGAFGEEAHSPPLGQVLQ